MAREERSGGWLKVATRALSTIAVRGTGILGDQDGLPGEDTASLTPGTASCERQGCVEPVDLSHRAC